MARSIRRNIPPLAPLALGALLWTAAGGGALAQGAPSAVETLGALSPSPGEVQSAPGAGESWAELVLKAKQEQAAPAPAPASSGPAEAGPGGGVGWPLVVGLALVAAVIAFVLGRRLGGGGSPAPIPELSRRLVLPGGAGELFLVRGPDGGWILGLSRAGGATQLFPGWTEGAPEPDLRAVLKSALPPPAPADPTGDLEIDQLLEELTGRIQEMAASGTGPHGA